MIARSTKKWGGEENKNKKKETKKKKKTHIENEDLENIVTGPTFTRIGGPKKKKRDGIKKKQKTNDEP